MRAVAALSSSFNRMTESLERLLEQQREKDRLQSELAIAQEVQNNLFPHSDLRLPTLELLVSASRRVLSAETITTSCWLVRPICVSRWEISAERVYRQHC